MSSRKSVTAAAALLLRQRISHYPPCNLKSEFPDSTSASKSASVDDVLADFVVQHPLGGVEQARRLGAIPAGGLQRVLNQVFLEAGDGIAQRDTRDSARRF